MPDVVSVVYFNVTPHPTAEWTGQQLHFTPGSKLSAGFQVTEPGADVAT